MSNFQYVIKATTPEEMRTQIVKWLYNHSIALSSQARISKLKGTKKHLEAQASAIQYAGRFIEEIMIDKPKSMTEDELLEGLNSNRTCDQV